MLGVRWQREHLAKSKEDFVDSIEEHESLLVT